MKGRKICIIGLILALLGAIFMDMSVFVITGRFLLIIGIIISVVIGATSYFDKTF